MVRRIYGLMVAVLVTGLIATACGDDDAATTVPINGGDAVTGTPSPPGTPAAGVTTTIAAGSEEVPSDDDRGLGAGLIGEGLTPDEIGRSIIFTANLAVEVTDVFSAAQQAQTAIAGLGGFLFGQETTTEPIAQSILTLKVLPENFAEALRRLGGLGRVTSQTVFADDVTERVVDLESRIATAEVSATRLRSLLESAADIEDVIELEAELLKRETDLEVLRGQLRTLGDQVALATITLVLSEPEPDVPEPQLDVTQTVYVGHDDGAGCPGSDELEGDEGDRVTFCLEIENSGDTLISDIEVRDQGLDADPDDFIVVEGDPSAVLAPGGRIILALETEAQPGMVTSPGVDATAVDEFGSPLRVEIELDIEKTTLQIARDDSLPGFTDALSESWEALQRVFGLGVVLAGAVVPFLWLIALLAGFVLWRRRRREESPVSGGQTSGDAAE